MTMTTMTHHFDYGYALPYYDNYTPIDAKEVKKVVSNKSASSRSRSASESTETPEEFFCPITLNIMKQPLVNRAGHNFERHAILEWINNKEEKGEDAVCPLTRRPIKRSDFIRNRTLELRIQLFCNSQENTDALVKDSVHHVCNDDEDCAQTSDAQERNQRLLMCSADDASEEELLHRLDAIALNQERQQTFIRKCIRQYHSRKNAQQRSQRRRCQRAFHHL